MNGSSKCIVCGDPLSSHALTAKASKPKKRNGGRRLHTIPTPKFFEAWYGLSGDERADVVSAMHEALPMLPNFLPNTKTLPEKDKAKAETLTALFREVVEFVSNLEPGVATPKAPLKVKPTEASFIEL